MNIKMKHSYYYLLTSCLIIGLSSPAIAHEHPDILGVPASATDYLQVTCKDESTHHLYFSLKSTGTATAPIVSAQVSKDSLILSTTDPKNTDKDGSQPISIAGGPGTYHITVVKSKQGRARYSFQDHCQTIDNGHPDKQDLQIMNHKR